MGGFETLTELPGIKIKCKESLVIVVNIGLKNKLWEYLQKNFLFSERQSNSR